MHIDTERLIAEAKRLCFESGLVDETDVEDVENVASEEWEAITYAVDDVEAKRAASLAAIATCELPDVLYSTIRLNPNGNYGRRTAFLRLLELDAGFERLIDAVKELDVDDSSEAELKEFGCECLAYLACSRGQLRRVFRLTPEGSPLKARVKRWLDDAKGRGDEGIWHCRAVDTAVDYCSELLNGQDPWTMTDQDWLGVWMRASRNDQHDGTAAATAFRAALIVSESTDSLHQLMRWAPTGSDLAVETLDRMVYRAAKFDDTLRCVRDLHFLTEEQRHHASRLRYHALLKMTDFAKELGEWRTVRNCSREGSYGHKKAVEAIERLSAES
ncbi:hypothetical protein ACFL26_00880 [Patescibacteria group bacterium]